MRASSFLTNFNSPHELVSLVIMSHAKLLFVPNYPSLLLFECLRVLSSVQYIDDGSQITDYEPHAARIFLYSTYTSTVLTI